MTRREPSRTSARGLLAVAVLGSLVVLAAACAEAPPARHAAPDAPPAPPSDHAVHSAGLRERMRSLQAFRQDALPAAPDLEARRELARTAEEMARSAETLAAVLDTTRLGPDQEADFYALAGRLRLRALELSRSAPGASREELVRRVDAVTIVCDDCHDRFRILPGTAPD